jgi:hypothetical protein
MRFTASRGDDWVVRITGPLGSCFNSTIAGAFAEDLLQVQRPATIASIDDCRLVSRRKDALQVAILLMATFAGMRHSMRFGREVF